MFHFIVGGMLQEMGILLGVSLFGVEFFPINECE